jgi:hypothetical protein
VLLLCLHAAAYVAVYVRLLRGRRSLRPRARFPWPSRVGR